MESTVISGFPAWTTRLWCLLGKEKRGIDEGLGWNQKNKWENDDVVEEIMEIL